MPTPGVGIGSPTPAAQAAFSAPPPTSRVEMVEWALTLGASGVLVLSSFGAGAGGGADELAWELLLDGVRALLDIDGDVTAEFVSVVTGGMEQAAKFVAQLAYFWEYAGFGGWPIEVCA